MRENWFISQLDVGWRCVRIKYRGMWMRIKYKEECGYLSVITKYSSHHVTLRVSRSECM